MGARSERANQDELLENAIRKSRSITIFLKNGVPLRGRVLAHDPYTVLMETERNQTLIYKHSITSIFPARFFPSRGN